MKKEKKIIKKKKKRLNTFLLKKLMAHMGHHTPSLFLGFIVPFLLFLFLLLFLGFIVPIYAI